MVVDELAFTNPPDSRHPQRYQDVQELLEAGMDVFTTLNLLEIASEAGPVQSIAGIQVREIVPDNVLDGAEIRLIDLPPLQLLKRLHVQLPYLVQDRELSEANFFSESNLVTLRNRAWRLVADRMASETQDFMEKHQLHGPWKAGPRLLAVVAPDMASEQIVRFARRLADSSHSPWVALYVETSRVLDESKLAQITRSLALAEELGAEVVTTTDDDQVQGVLRVASQRNATQIIVGKSTGSSWRIVRRDPFLRRLIRASGDFEICLVPARPGPVERTPGRIAAVTKSSWWPYAISVAVVVAITVFTFCFGSKMGGPYAVALIYLLAVVVLGSFARRGPTLMAATLSALLWNYFILPPVYAFQVAHVQDALLLGTYFVVALILGQLTTQIRAQQQGERLREEHATALYLLTRELNEAGALEQIVQRAIQNMERAFKGRVLMFKAEAEGEFQQLPLSAETSGLPAEDRQAVAWVFKHAQRAGKFTPDFPLAEALYAPLTTPTGVLGVISLRLAQSFPPTIHQFNLLDSFSQQIAFALDRHRLREISERAKLLAESERLGQTLLNSVSHEMRTPIAILKTAANNLIHIDGWAMDEAGQDIVAAINDATERLNRLVGNVLDITRLESGHIKPRFTECAVSDLVHLAMTNTQAELTQHKVSVEMPPNLPIVPMDFVLMEQALTNLLSNAACHTAPGTSVQVKAHAERNFLVLEVADRGPGIRSESMGRLFDKFYRGPSAPTGGTGLGLSLVKGFVEAQGGTVQAKNRSGGGAAFIIRLPLGNIPEVLVETTV